MTFYAHSLENEPMEKWETLSEHEEQVGRRCAQLLKRIDDRLAAWGDLLGRWHDLGKYLDKFQAYLRQSNGVDATAETRPGRVDHSTAGAQHAKETLPPGIGDLIAYVIAGHHAGLADAVSSTGHKGSGLRERLKRDIEDYKKNAPEELLLASRLVLPKDLFSSESQSRCGFQLSMLCRMLFSALCDADFLATEQFMSPETAIVRDGKTCWSMRKLCAMLDTHLSQFAHSETKNNVNLCRAEILCAARRPLTIVAESSRLPFRRAVARHSLHLPLR